MIRLCVISVFKDIMAILENLFLIKSFDAYTGGARDMCIQGYLLLFSNPLKDGDKRSYSHFWTINDPPGLQGLKYGDKRILIYKWADLH